MASCPVTDISALMCPDNQFCADVVCDDDIDQCVTTDVSGDQCPSDSCTLYDCDEEADACVGGAPIVCPPDTGCRAYSCNIATGLCDVTDFPDGQPCDDGMFCNGVDSCMGGVCAHAGSPCPGPDGDTNCAESCDETSDTCTAFDPAGTSCRPATGVCDVEETCTGDAAACPADAVAPAETECGPDLGICDPPDVCDGASKNGCQLRVAIDGTVCGFPNAGPCDATDECFQGSCLILNQPPGTVCRPGSGDVCDPAETCTGDEITCPADVVTPAGTTCRDSAGVCDLAETCSGVPGAGCPADAMVGPDVECRTATGVCDAAETCTGTDAACPADVVAPAGTECGPDLGICDPPDVCDGASKNGCELRVAVDGTECGFPNAGPCDATDECFQGSCLILNQPPGTVCRPGSGDVCDPAETCTGDEITCPADVVTPAGTECRGATDLCDAAETCTGTAGAACPVDGLVAAGTECRPAADVCDVAETCDGGSAQCPPDALRSAGATCRDSAGVCDVAEVCDGAGATCPADGFAAAGTECNPAAGECDAAETCTGSGPTCPAENAMAPDGTACALDNECSVGAGPTCQAGTCTLGSECPIVRIGDIEPVGPKDELDVEVDIPADAPGVGRVIVRVDGFIQEEPTATAERTGDGAVAATMQRSDPCAPGKRVLRRKLRLLEGELTPARVAKLAARLNKRGKKCVRRGDVTVDATIDVTRKAERRSKPSLLDRFRRSARWKRG